MPRKINLDMISLTNYISKNYGNEFGGAAVRAAASEFGVSYPTVMKRLDQYKVGYGKWNLSVQEQLEQTYNAPAAAPEGAQSFQYDVSKQARKRASEIANKPNPASPLAAG